MSGLIEAASGILATAERRVETTAQNIAHAATPGFKRQIAFTQALEQRAPDNPAPARPDSHTAPGPQLLFASDFTQGKLRDTGRPLDLAIFGAGFVRLRDGGSFVYTRGGTFTTGPDGTVIDAAGRVLQQAGGGDLTLDSTAPEITGDGSVIAHGLPVAAIGLFEPTSPAALTSLGGGLFRAPDTMMQDATGSILRQGQLEGANVVMSDEMIGLMTANRQAESGARLVQFYDQLVGQAITTFSRSNK